MAVGRVDVIAASGERNYTLTLGSAALALEAALLVREQWSGGRVNVTTGGTTRFLTIYPQFLNPNPPIIADLRFRRALLHAIDRQALVDSLVAAQSSVAHSMVGPMIVNTRPSRTASCGTTTTNGKRWR